MVARLLVSCLWFGLAGMAGQAAQTPAAEAQPGAECLKCHQTIQAALKRKVRHQAIDMGCDSCHLNHRDKKAAPAKTEHYLNAAQAEVCSGCHDYKEEKVVKAHKGQPFQTSTCGGCHDPHASDLPKLMAAHAHGPFGAR